MSGFVLDFREDFLSYLFQDVDWTASGALIGLGSTIYYSLHTAVPTGAQNSNEATAAYGGYTRIGLTRDNGAAGHSLSTINSNAKKVTNIGLLLFPACTSGSETEYFIGVGPSSSGATPLWGYAPITPNGASQQIFIGQVTAGGTDTIQAFDSAFSDDDRILVKQIGQYTFPAASPTLTGYQLFYVDNVAGDTFQLRTAAGGGGSLLDFSAAGFVYVQKVAGIAVSPPIAPSFAAGKVNIIIGGGST